VTSAGQRAADAAVSDLDLKAEEASSMLPPVTLAWGVNPERTDQNRVTITTASELGEVLGRIHSAALLRGVAQQIDVWEGELPVGDTVGGAGDAAEQDDFLPEPFIQVVVGHPQRSGVRWLGVEEQVQAISPSLPMLTEPVLYDNGGATDPLPPGLLRLTFAEMQHTMEVFVQKRIRADDVAWVDLPEL
jgi:hypothetical protein